MADLMTDAENNKDTISEDDVIAWLKKHPDFLSRNPDICELLLPPKTEQGKGVADFQHFMIKRLREDRESIIDEAREIVETSRTNMNNQSRMFKAVIMLLDSQTFEEFIRTITMDMASILDVDIITLLVESDDHVIPHVNLSGVKAVPAGTVDNFMKGQRVKLEDHIQGNENVYGGGAGLVKSQLTMKLTVAPDMPPALLAFGSRDPQQFTPGQGTELIAFLGHVIERYMRIWLNV